MESDQWREIFSLSGEHLVLVASSIAMACAIAIPGAILLARRPGPRRAAIAVANILQTIPSLALFGFLIPIPLIGGIGKRTAIVALVVYALLPLCTQHAGGYTGRGPGGARIGGRHGNDGGPGASRRSNYRSRRPPSWRDCESPP